VAADNISGFFGLESAIPPDFYSSHTQLTDAGGGIPYAHQMRKAWEELGLDGIYCVQRVPTVYFKSIRYVNPNMIRELHAKLWNHGIASILVLVSTTEVVVLSALAYPARSADDIFEGHRVVERLNLLTDAFRARNIINDLNSGRMYQEHERSFSEDASIDRYLLKNLGAARDELLEAGGMEITTVHALLGQLIFVCYLTDRKIINRNRFGLAGAPGVGSIQEFFSQPRLSVRNAKETLKSLLAGLQSDFHGSLFGQPTLARIELNSKHVDVLRRFFSAQEMGSQQLSLNFWAYDFSVIPVETISSIYENFLGAEGADSKRNAGAFYTPKHLAELTVDHALGAETSLLNKRILDPSCGSGIFLIIAFSRMAEELRSKYPRQWNITRAKALQELLTKNLCGVDASKTACNIACFGLYLALLDQLKPRDIEELRVGHQFVLPELLQQNTGDPITAGVVHSDFFDSKLSFSEPFDLIVGNPPWVGRDATASPAAQMWCKNYESLATKFLSFNEMVPQYQSAHAFMWKVPVHLKQNGQSCMLLPTKVLLNRTDRFQEAWFSEHCVEEILMLADYRFVLFEDAKCPSMMVKFRAGEASDGHVIEYIVPKVEALDPRRGVIHVSSDDRKQVSTKQLLESASRKEASILWKTMLWGSNRDIQFLKRLLALPPLSDIAGEPSANKRWIKGQGFKPMRAWAKTGHEAWWGADLPYISARNTQIDMVIVPEDCEPIGEEYNVLACLPNKKLFMGPKVLVNQGFTKIGFCEFDVLFQDSIQSIAGSLEDRKLLCFLTAVLRSSLANYYLFHTAANWGTERNKVHLFELLRMPFPLPQDTFEPQLSEEIVSQCAEIILGVAEQIADQPLLRNQYTIDADARLEDLVYKYYAIGSDERKLIRDTIEVWEPSSTPHTVKTPMPTTKTPSQELRASYADILTSHLNSWAEGSSYCVSARGSSSTDLRIGVLILEKNSSFKPYEEFDYIELLEALAQLEQKTRERGGVLLQHKNLKIFNGNALFIVKPLMKRYWTATAALNDADEIAHAILRSGGQCDLR